MENETNCLFAENIKADHVRYLHNVTVQRGTGFGDQCNIYLHYCLDLHSEWELSRPNELYGSTHQSRACINGANHFGHSFTLDISKNIQSDISHPLLLVKVFNVGWWNRQQALGYGFAPFPTTAGSTSVTIATWKPESSSINQELEQLFLNLSPQLENLSYVGIPKNDPNTLLSRFPFTTQPSGTIQIDFNTIVQKGKNIIKDELLQKSRSSSTRATQSAIDEVVEAYHKARQRLHAAQQAALRR